MIQSVHCRSSGTGLQTEVEDTFIQALTNSLILFEFGDFTNKSRKPIIYQPLKPYVFLTQGETNCTENAS